ncbi:hypothetical protein AVEN_257393-1, partial [Araneus ventricosus]
ISRLTPIKQLCPEYIEFNHIKAVIAVLERKYGLNAIPLENDGSPKQTTPEAKPPDAPSDAPSSAGASTSKSPSIISSKRKDSSHLPQSDIPAVKKLKSNKLFKL